MYEAYSDLIVGTSGIYKPADFDDNLTASDLDWSHAYIMEPYYFLYRGPYLGKNKSVLPGLYQSFDENDKNGIKIIYPLTEEDKKIYEVDTHWSKLPTEEIVKAISENEENFNLAVDGKATSLPEISGDDDLLKRLLKTATAVKSIDIDSLKPRFSDRNSLFNYKSNMRSDAKTSFMIFDRGCDAMGLDYYITIVDRDPENPIGRAIDSKEVQERVMALNEKAGVNPALPYKGFAITVSNRDTVSPKGDL